MEYFYGPVHSRRLGFSLGVDVVPRKACSFECVYCQVGKTPHKTIRRFSWVNLNKLKKELKTILKTNPWIDYITFSGSGEPTLHKGLDKIIRSIKKISKNKYPVCVITNSSLLYRKEVRKELQAADLVIPSLDAVDNKSFTRINRPHKSITFNKVTEGILKFSQEYKGRIWLEVMLLKNYNDSGASIKRFKDLISRISPELIHLNVPARPSLVSNADLMPSQQAIKGFKEALGSTCRIASPRLVKNKQKVLDVKAIMDSLRRRPQRVDDLACSLGLKPKMVERYLAGLLSKRRVCCILKNKKKYFIVNDKRTS